MNGYKKIKTRGKFHNWKVNSTKTSRSRTFPNSRAISRGKRWLARWIPTARGSFVVYTFGLHVKLVKEPDPKRRFVELRIVVANMPLDLKVSTNWKLKCLCIKPGFRTRAGVGASEQLILTRSTESGAEPKKALLGCSDKNPFFLFFFFYPSSPRAPRPPPTAGSTLPVPFFFLLWGCITSYKVVLIKRKTLSTTSNIYVFRSLSNCRFADTRRQYVFSSELGDIPTALCQMVGKEQTKVRGSFCLAHVCFMNGFFFSGGTSEVAAGGQFVAGG